MLDYGKIYDKVRVFFNAHSAHPYIWSVDDGDLRNETSFSSITIYGDAETKYIGQKPNPCYPVSWFEFKDAELFPDPTDKDGLIVGNYRE